MKKNSFPKGLIIGIAILLPCIGFFLGMEYQKDIDGTLSLYPTISAQPIVSGTTAPTSSIPANTACKTDNDCILYNPQRVTDSTLCCHNQDMLCTNDQTQITAVNKTFYEKKVNQLCKRNALCPMYRIMCSAKIQQTIQKIQARCMQNVCQVQKGL